MEYIVVLKSAEFREQFKLDLASNGISISKEFSGLKRFFQVSLDDVQLSYLTGHPLVLTIEKEKPASICIDQQLANDSATIIDNWGLDRIDQREPVLDNKYRYFRTAHNVDVYILDTGIKIDHDEFEGRAIALYDAVNESGVPFGVDGNGHGTHVAGIVGGKNFGVAKGARLYAVKVLNSRGSGTSFNVINGINSTITHHLNKNTPTFTRPSVVNMSLTFPSVSTDIDAAVNDMIDAGIVTCVAAGNNARDARNYSPASVPNAITVGAMNNLNGQDVLSTFSNTSASASEVDPIVGESSTNLGSGVDIFAPGQEIMSAWPIRVAYNTLNASSPVENYLATVGAGQTVYSIRIDINSDVTPVIQIGTRDNPTLLLDAGPGRPKSITQGQQNTYSINHTFTSQTDIYIYFAKSTMSAGQATIRSNISSKNSSMRLSGTSMASPHVAGVAALELQSWTAGPTTSGEVLQIVDLIVNNATVNSIQGMPSTTPNRLLYMRFNSGASFNWITPEGEVASINEFGNLITSVTATAFDNDGNSVPVTYSSGDLPSWLTLSISGVITGVAPEVQFTQRYYFTVSAISNSEVKPRRFYITVVDVYNRPPEWVTPSGSLGQVIEGNSSSNLPIQLQATDYENDGYTFSLLTPSSLPLPPGLSLSSSGLISGTPAPGVLDKTYNFTVRLTDGTRFSDRTFSLDYVAINSSPFWFPSAIGTVLLDHRQQGESVAYDFNSNLSSNYVIDADTDLLSYRIVPTFGEALPADLVLSPSGILQGILNVVGTFTFTVEVTDGAITSTRKFSYIIDPLTIILPPQWITSAGSLGTVVEGDFESYFVSAEDPQGEILTYSYAPEVGDSLPPGFSVYPNGIISGTAGFINDDTVYSFRVAVTNQSLLTSYRRFEIMVTNVPGHEQPYWVTEPGYIGTIKGGYPSDLYIKAENPRVSDLTYSIVSGTLPNGLILHPKSGDIIGIPTDVFTDQTFTFEAVAINDVESSEVRVFSITVIATFTEEVLRIDIPTAQYSLEIISVAESLLSGNESFLYRGFNPFYNINFSPLINVVSGLKMFPPGSTTTDIGLEFVKALSTNHFPIKLKFKDVKWAAVKNEDDETIYEVIYVELIDSQEAAALTSNFDHVGNPLNISTITPPSINNMRTDLLDTHGITGSSELLETWMGNEWKLGIPLLYVLPNKAEYMLYYGEESIKNQLKNKELIVDRYLVRNISKVQIDSYIDTLYPLPEVSTSYTIDKYIKFPQMDITDDNQTSGDILGSKPIL